MTTEAYCRAELSSGHLWPDHIGREIGKSGEIRGNQSFWPDHKVKGNREISKGKSGSGLREIGKSVREIGKSENQEIGKPGNQEFGRHGKSGNREIK